MTDYMQQLEQFKNSGNSFFTQSKFTEAIQDYQKAMRTFLTLVEGKKIESDTDFITIILKVQIPCYMNSAQCFIKIGNWEAANAHCDEALKMA